MSDRELRVSKIKDGTVIDHISGGYALDVAKILGITGHERGVMTIAINVPSKRLRVKDIVKIEGRELNSREVNRIALVAPHASINIIRDYCVVEKLEVKLPKVIEDIIKCVNPSVVEVSLLWLHLGEGGCFAAALALLFMFRRGSKVYIVRRHILNLKICTNIDLLYGCKT